MFAPWKKSYDQARQHIKKQRHCFAHNGLCSQSYGFSSSHVFMWELDYKESWELKNWCFWTVVFETTLESPLNCKDIKPVHPKGNQSWIFIGRTEAEAETPILWPSDVKSWLVRKAPDTGKDWRQEEKGMTEDTMVEWHHGLDGHEFDQGPGVGEGQGSLLCCRSQRFWQDWVTELNWYVACVCFCFPLSGRFGILYLLPNLKISHWSNLMCLYVQCLGYLMGFVNTLFEQFPLIILRFHHHYFT